MLSIGPYKVNHSLILAPMAGVTDVPFRRMCRRLGAGLTIGEMVASREDLRATELSERRFTVDPEDPIPVVQLLGSASEMMAQAARYAVEKGAKIVDINFGCPARMICGQACGSALMADEGRAIAILEAVRNAVEIPLTVKMRTGWDGLHKNAMTLAQAAQSIGYDAVTIHGRTREDRFRGEAEYETVKAVSESLTIPVIANGDIDGARKAQDVLEKTHARGLMIGRAAEGAPWLFRELSETLEGRPCKPLNLMEKLHFIEMHVREHFSYWGENETAFRTFRKHLLWYLKDFPNTKDVVRNCFEATNSAELFGIIKNYFESVAGNGLIGSTDCDQ